MDLPRVRRREGPMLKRALLEAIPVVIVAIVCAIVGVIWLKLLFVLLGGR